jgi:5'-methylthioadenosine phosphorylase
MTTCPEAFLAREAEMCYAVVNSISDYDVWHETEEPVTVGMVLDILHRNARLASQAIVGLADRLGEPRTCGCGNALGQALLTQREQIPAETLERLRPLVGRYLA